MLLLTAGRREGAEASWVVVEVAAWVVGKLPLADPSPKQLLSGRALGM